MLLLMNTDDNKHTVDRRRASEDRGVTLRCCSQGSRAQSERQVLGGGEGRVVYCILSDGNNEREQKPRQTKNSTQAGTRTRSLLLRRETRYPLRYLGLLYCNQQQVQLQN